MERVGDGPEWKEWQWKGNRMEDDSIVDGEAIMLDVFEPRRQRIGHPRYALGFVRGEVVAFEGIVDDIE